MAAAPAATAAADEDDLPIPSDIKAVFLGGLFVLAMLVACYVAAEIVLRSCSPSVLSLVLQPAIGYSSGSVCRAGLLPFSSSFYSSARLAGWGGAAGTGRQLAQKLLVGFPNWRERLSFLSRRLPLSRNSRSTLQGWR